MSHYGASKNTPARQNFGVGGEQTWNNLLLNGEKDFWVWDDVNFF